MVFDKLRRYEVQAGAGAALSLLAIVPLLGAIVLILRNFHSDLRQIVYQSNNYALALLGCIALSALAAIVGGTLGYNSAGQRRNDRPKRSWVGFLVGAFVLTLNVILLIGFVMLRLKQPGG